MPAGVFEIVLPPGVEREDSASREDLDLIGNMRIRGAGMDMTVIDFDHDPEGNEPRAGLFEGNNQNFLALDGMTVRRYAASNMQLVRQIRTLELRNFAFRDSVVTDVAFSVQHLNGDTVEVTNNLGGRLMEATDGGDIIRLTGSDNTASSVLELNNGSLSDSLFINNTYRFLAGGFGTAVQCFACDITRSTFVGNTASAVGGAVFMRNASVTNSLFFNNRATGEHRRSFGTAYANGLGGAVHSEGRSQIFFSTFIGNATGLETETRPENAGGAIYATAMNGDDHILTLKGNVIVENSSESGPDIFNNSVSPLVSQGFNLVTTFAGSNTATLATDGSGFVADGVFATTVIEGVPRPVPRSGGGADDLVPVASCTQFDGALLELDLEGGSRPVGEGCDAGAIEARP